MNTLDWGPSSDKFLKKKEIEVHEKYHSHLSKDELTRSQVLDNSKRRMRAKSLENALRKIGAGLKGNVLEVGAGDGWCSAYMLDKYYASITELHTMEINQAAITDLIPKVFSAVGVPSDKSTLIHGSFNNIQHENYYDYVVAMGAIHHSSNLYCTLKEIYKSLKPGGWLIAQEPYMSDHTSNQYYEKRADQVVNFKGLEKVKNIDRSDIFFRMCEYRTAAYHAGFEFNYFSVYSWSLLQLKRTLLFQNANRPKNMMMYIQKPVGEIKLPTITGWE